MLETLREYAWEQLEESERIALRQRHSHYYLELAEQSHLELRGPEQRAWRFQADYESARAYHTESLAVRREWGDMISIARSLDLLGHVALYQAEYEQARVLYVRLFFAMLFLRETYRTMEPE